MAGKHMQEAAAPSSIFKARGRREHSGGRATTKTTADGWGGASTDFAKVSAD